MTSNYEAKQLNIPQIIFYHLIPGIPVLLFAFLFTSPAIGIGLTMFFSLLIAFLLFLVPVQWGILKVIAHKEGKKLRDIVDFKEKLPIHKTILWSLPCIAFAAIVFPVGTGIESPLWTIFAWIPDWFRVNRSLDAGNLLILTIILNFIIRGLLVPFTEEVYFRGFLLPRMSKLGKFAPLISAVLFSVYHFFAPWENVARALAVLPFIYVTWHKKNVYISIISHVAVNLLSCIAMLISII